MYVCVRVWPFYQGMKASKISHTYMNKHAYMSENNHEHYTILHRHTHIHTAKMCAFLCQTIKAHRSERGDRVLTRFAAVPQSVQRSQTCLAGKYLIIQLPSSTDKQQIHTLTNTLSYSDMIQLLHSKRC